MARRVRFRGLVPSTEMPAVVGGFDVLAGPSLTGTRWKEQYGRMLIEAMGCEVAVIGSDSGEIPEVIGDAGLVVAEGDVAAWRSRAAGAGGRSGAAAGARGGGAGAGAGTVHAGGDSRRDGGGILGGVPGGRGRCRRGDRHSWVGDCGRPLLRSLRLQSNGRYADTTAAVDCGPRGRRRGKVAAGTRLLRRRTHHYPPRAWCNSGV